LHSKRLASVTCAAVIAGALFALSAGAASAANQLQGAGSTFVAPIMAEWTVAWANATGNPTPSYQAVGSGAGLKDIGSGLVDFGASDAPLSASTTPCNCHQIPWALGAVGIGYNLPGVRGLHLTGSVLAAIYTGAIRKWNDRHITALNRGKSLPNLTITPIHRGDGSGTSYAFTDYESAVSGSFAGSIGRGTKPTFPVGPGGTGSSGVTSVLLGTRGAIAYVDTAYLIAHHLPAAAIQNRAGNFEYPNLRNISAAAAVVHSIPGNLELHIVNPPASARIAYPISSFTYVVTQPTDPLGNGAELRSFISYVLTTGQAFGPALDYVPIPGNIRAADQAALSNVH
jgi:phosphate transport system substrate-binding protein